MKSVSGVSRRRLPSVAVNTVDDSYVTSIQTVSAQVIAASKPGSAGLFFIHSFHLKK